MQETRLGLSIITAHKPNRNRMQDNRLPVQVLLTLVRLQRNPQCLFYCHICHIL